MKKRVVSWMLALGLGLTAPAMALEAKEYQTLASGQYASFYIKEDGSLWGWGENDHGAVGNGTTDPCPTPVKILDDVVSVETCGAYTLAIKQDSSLWAWGEITFDQVYLSPTKIMDDVSSVWTSDKMWIILKTDGALYTWGVLWRIGETHRLLIGSQSPEKALDNVVSVALVENTIAAVAADGSVWTWGNNAYGRLGDGSSEDTYIQAGAGKNDGRRGICQRRQSRRVPGIEERRYALELGRS